MCIAWISMSSASILLNLECWLWSLKGKSTGGKEKMSTNVKFESTRRCFKAMNSAQGRQKINPSVPWWVFGVVSIYILIITMIMIITLIIISLFSAWADFQRQDAMWLHRKAIQKKQFAAAIIWLILLSYLTTTDPRGNELIFTLHLVLVIKFHWIK